MALIRLASTIFVVGLATASMEIGSARAQTVPVVPVVWIFSGVLPNSHEPFSGTLVVGKDDIDFELRLAGNATCDGSQASGGVGLVRLAELTCSDDRTMRALFVPQGASELKVFGHVGDERFVASAHVLGTEPVPDGRVTAQRATPTLQSRPGELGPVPAIKPTERR